MKQILIVFWFLTTSAFGQDTTYFDANWVKTNKNGSKFYRIEKKENEKWVRTDYYKEFNQVQMIGHYSSLNPEIRSGSFEWFHSNGKLEHRGNYEEDKKVGEHKWYSDNGFIEVIENYKLGELDGIYKAFYKSGKISTESSFVNGLQCGNTKFFREDGSLHSEGNFKDGDRDGLWKFYDEKGNIIGTNVFKTEYLISEAKIFIKLPNSHWNLDERVEGNLPQYMFKRESITDNKGREIIPAMLVYSEDASKYNQDLLLFSFAKQKSFIERGVIIDTITTHNDAGYRLSINNSVIYKCHYSEREFDHILYMIHLITKENIGVQIYMDMTKEITDEYENEFRNTIKSIIEK